VRLRKRITKKQITETPIPIGMPIIGSTKPAAGVIATRPCHRAGSNARNSRPMIKPAQEHPGQGRRCRRRIGRDKRAGSQAAGVKALPALKQTNRTIKDLRRITM